MAKVSEFQVAKTGFELFCQQRDYKILDFYTNPKNPKQFVGDCCDANGKHIYILISQKGNYYQRMLKNVWVPIPYVLESGR